MDNQIKISYVIITWNGRHFMIDLLRSLENQLRRPDVECIIVDNGSTDGTTDFLKTNYPYCQLIALKENHGVARARNMALKEAKGRYLFILDNDMIVNDEAIATLENYMDLHPRVGLGAVRLVGTDGKTQENCRRYPGIGEKLKNIFNRSHAFVYQKQIEENLPFEPDYVIGACQMIRREAFERVGFLDEKIFYGPEDCDYCLRVRQAGYKIIYLPMVSIVHCCQRMTNSHPFSAMGFRHAKALIYFYWKYKRFW